jgi:exonuclease SbcC
MKPLQLSIEGLHSFKEKQVIDFEQLSETGLFGIFGQTGSGKSTVLDAMTLALYGAVFRAASRTQGVLNSQCDQMKVSFTFTIGVGGERKIFWVERSFKRHKDKRDFVQAVVCRLVEIRYGQERMIAENTNEVTRKVEEIIGLNMEDFTRSVVLPQGEFAQFLQLKDAERVRMLERIFALANYGSKLTEKVRRERERLAIQLEVLGRAIQEHGEVSREQLVALKTELAAKEADLENISRQAVRFEQQYNEQRDLWQLQTELEQLVIKQRAHFQSRNEMALKKALLEQAQLAQQVVPYLESAQKAAADLASSREELQRATAAHQNEAAANQRIMAEFTEVETAYLEKQPKLIAKRTQVEGVLTLETEKQAKESEQNQRERELAKLTGALREVDGNLSNAEHNKAVKDAQRQSLETNIKELTIDMAFKERILQGVELEKDLERIGAEREKLLMALAEQTQQLSPLQQQLQQKLVLLAQLTKKADRLQAELQVRQQQKPGDLESYTGRQQELSRFEAALNRIRICEADLAALQAELTQQRRNLQPLQAAQEQYSAIVAQEEQNQKNLEELHTRLVAEVRSLEENNVAAGLARALKAGKPCPVCGSSKHPRLAESKSERLETKQAKLAEVEKGLDVSREQLEGYKRELFQCLVQTEQYQNHCNDIQIKIDNGTVKLAEFRKDLEPAWREKSVAELETKLQRFRVELEEYRRAIRSFEEQQQILQQEFNTVNEAKLTTNNQVQLLTAQSEAEIRKRQKLTEELQMIAARVDQKQQQLQILHQQLQVTRFQLEYPRVLHQERQVAEIREKEAALTAELVLMESAVIKLRQEREMVNLKVREYKTIVQNLAREIAEREAKINMVTEGKSPQELLDAINEYLVKLVRKYEYCKEQWAISQTRLQNFNNQLVEARKHLELSQEAIAHSNGVLSRALQEKGFLSQNDLQPALRSPVEQAELQATITEYEDAGKRYQHQIESLREKIAGRALTAAEWQAIQDMKEKLAFQREQLLTDNATLHAKLTDMADRFSKVTQYFQERRETAARKAMVDEITQLLQGEAFVAYIAEEHLHYILWDASRRLGLLTQGRYLLTLDEKKDFCVADNTNGGIVRPVSSLSGGETFLVSFSLALALSGKIQLNGRNPLEFFFLDEGFGTLDPQLLEVVMDSLEKLRQQNLTIGVISHMPELRNRISRRLIITAATPDGKGSRVHIEKA